VIRLWVEQDDNNMHKPSATNSEKFAYISISMAWHQPEKWVTADHFETWCELASEGQFDGQGDHPTPKPYVRQAFCKYLEFGIFAGAGASACEI
jgi:hypothetical protein